MHMGRAPYRTRWLDPTDGDTSKPEYRNRLVVLLSTYFLVLLACSPSHHGSFVTRCSPAGCCLLVFVVPYQSLLFHFSLFSVMAFFSTAVVFSTLFHAGQPFSLLRNEHEDDRDTLCIVSELKEAAASDKNNHSSLPWSSSSSPSEDEG